MKADALAEEILAGRSAAEALPLVEAHLAACPGCRDEFDALLAALRANESAESPSASSGPDADTMPGAPRRWWQFWRA